jgi:hypothetical protein
MAQLPFHPVLPVLAVGGVAAAFLLGDKPRSRSQWLGSFGSWAGPASETEDEQVGRTERMVRAALEQSRYTTGYNLSFIAQGSSSNNTNVKRRSDLDLIAVHPQSWSLPARGEQLPFVGGSDTLEQASAAYRSSLIAALRGAFGYFGVSEGDKCVKIAPIDRTRVACDVLPAFRFRQYFACSVWPGGVPIWRDGIIFMTASGKQVVSYPEQHLANGRQKNKDTGYRYKQVVRILKKLKANLEENAFLIPAGMPPSFEIESAVYNVPNDALIRGDLFDAVDAALRWLITKLATPATTNALLQVNRADPMFPNWTTPLPSLLSPQSPGEPPAEVARFRNFAETTLAKINKRP